MNGIHTDLSHQKYLEADGVSASQLKRHLPEFYKPFTGSSSADFGSTFHARFTGDPTPVVAVAAAGWTGKAAQTERESVLASGGLAILERDIATLDGMEAAVRAHSEAHALLVEAPGRWELSVFADVDEVPSKCRFDKLTDDGIGVDIKVTKNMPGQHWLTRAVVEFGYEIQQVHYEEVASFAGIDLEAFRFVFVQNVEPFAVTVVELDWEFLKRGQALRDLALQRLLHPSMTDPYPGASGTLELNLPRWAKL
jgi:hypothetical protein